MFSDTNTNIPRVLIIEKGEGLGSRLEKRLRGAYEFYSASTIDDSLALIKNKGIHGILLDIESFGREDGFLGTRRIKATNGNGKLPVIALLPDGDAGMKTDCLLAGCTTFIIQPVSPETLEVVISEVLNLTAAYRQKTGEKAVS